MREFDVVLMEDETGGYVALVPTCLVAIPKATLWQKLWKT
jgi:hypothetical protein